MNENTLLVRSDQFEFFQDDITKVFIAIYAICINSYAGKSILGKTVKILPIYRQYGNLSDASSEYSVPLNIKVGKCKVLDEIKWTEINRAKGFLIYEHKENFDSVIKGLYDDRKTLWSAQVMLSQKPITYLDPSEYPRLIGQLTSNECAYWERKKFFGNVCFFLSDKVCLNWRLRTGIGSKCLYILNKNEKNESIKEFCQENKFVEDCKCINRHLYKDYNDQKNLSYSRNIPDYNWYIPCASEFYLRFESLDNH